LPHNRETKGKAGKNVRPTSGKVLSALLNILNASGHLRDGRFLDLFSGTGAVALAALERGARSVLAVEADRAAAAAISARMRARYDEGTARCLCADVRRALPRIAAQYPDGFDIVFADPPYCLGWGRELPPLIERHASLLAPDGVFVLERSARETPAETALSRDDRIYGETVLSIYRGRPDDEREGASC